MDDVCTQIINQFLFLSAGTAALTKLKEMIRRPEEIPTYLAEALPARATFFICYIMLRSFTGFSLELLRVVDLIVIPIKRKWFCYTPREDEAAWRPPYVLYDRLVSIHRFAQLSFRSYLLTLIYRVAKQRMCMKIARECTSRKQKTVEPLVSDRPLSSETSFPKYQTFSSQITAFGTSCTRLRPV